MKRRHLLAVAAVVLSMAACGADGSGTSYWRTSFQGGTFGFYSTVVDGDQISGVWTPPTPPGTAAQQVHFTGVKNSDGTYATSIFTGSTVTIDGDTMTLQYAMTKKTTASKISESDFQAGISGK